MKTTPTKKFSLAKPELVDGKKFYVSVQTSPEILGALGKHAERSGITRHKYLRICLQMAAKRGEVFTVSSRETVIGEND